MFKKKKKEVKLNTIEIYKDEIDGVLIKISKQFLNKMIKEIKNNCLEIGDTFTIQDCSPTKEGIEVFKIEVNGESFVGDSNKMIN